MSWKEPHWTLPGPYCISNWINIMLLVYFTNPLKKLWFLTQICHGKLEHQASTKDRGPSFHIKVGSSPILLWQHERRGEWELVEVPRRVRARANRLLQTSGSTEDSKVREATILMGDILTYGNYIKSWLWLHIYTRWLTMLWHLPFKRASCDKE